jgi:hypothetical protein
MKTILNAAIAMILIGFGSGARAGVDIGISGDEGGIREFHLAVGDFYRVPETQVVEVRQRNVPEEELPVVFFLASRAHVAPDVIVALRQGGKSWLDITYYYGMGADIYYVPARAVDGPPYGRALGYYKNKPQKQWKYIKLTDDEVVNLVNLQFISKHYGYPPNDIIRVRSEGKDFVEISRDAKGGKILKGAALEKDDRSKTSKGSGKSNKTKSKKK